MMEMSEKKIRALGNLFKRIGNFSMLTLNNRIIFQKTVYLMQAFGLYIGYRFSWYLYGPYSTGLARDGFGLIDVFKYSKPLEFIEDWAEERFEKFLDFIEPIKKDPKQLEMLASLHFLKKLYPREGKEAIIDKVEHKQPYITRDECLNAWAYLEKHGMVQR